MIQRILAIVVFIYVVLVSAGVGVVYWLAPKLGFFGGLAVAALGFAAIAFLLIRMIAARLKGVMAMVRMMQTGGMAGSGMPGAGRGARGPTIDAEFTDRTP